MTDGRTHARTHTRTDDIKTLPSAMSNGDGSTRTKAVKYHNYLHRRGYAFNSVCCSVRLSTSMITKKLWLNFLENFGRVGLGTSNNRLLHFGSDATGMGPRFFTFVTL